MKYIHFGQLEDWEWLVPNLTKDLTAFTLSSKRIFIVPFLSQCWIFTLKMYFCWHIENRWRSFGLEYLMKVPNTQTMLSPSSLDFEIYSNTESRNTINLPNIISLLRKTCFIHFFLSFSTFWGHFAIFSTVTIYYFMVFFFLCYFMVLYVTAWYFI